MALHQLLLGDLHRKLCVPLVLFVRLHHLQVGRNYITVMDIHGFHLDCFSLGQLQGSHPLLPFYLRGSPESDRNQDFCQKERSSWAARNDDTMVTRSSSDSVTLGGRSGCLRRCWQQSCKSSSPCGWWLRAKILFLWVMRTALTLNPTKARKRFCTCTCGPSQPGFCSRKVAHFEGRTSAFDIPGQHIQCVKLFWIAP